MRGSRPSRARSATFSSGRLIALAAAFGAAWLLPACSSTGGAGSDIRLDPISVTRPSPSPLQPVSFLAGCWRGTFFDGSTVIDERWSPPEGGVMLGTTRFFRDGKLVDFEFGRMEAGAEGVIYTPYPGGERSPDPFILTGTGPGRVVFEAPAHDYPKRILYTVSPEGLEARIDGGEGDESPRVWRLLPKDCAGFPGM